MRGQRRPGRGSAAASTVAAALAVGAAVPATTAGPALTAGPSVTPRLPDVVQVVPADLGVVSDSHRGHRRFRLGFRSAAENHGTGPLIVRGRRPPGAATMTAAQTIRMSDGSSTTVPSVGILRFVRSEDHRHWHLLRFERYELHRAADFAMVRPDRKTGFCLGDRYDADHLTREPFEPRQPPYTGACGPDRPRLRRITEGISVGYGDDYKAQLEGQFIDVTGLPAGRYVLTHRANPGRRMREIRYDNNASSALIELKWPRGLRRLPTVEVLDRCPGQPRCG